ncbi:MAG: capsular polysaccharide transport system permease protein, partial [Paracoccaceae bacterium]
MALILREMSTRYGRTPGGYIWSILEPLAAILVLSVGFSLVMRTPSLGTSFLLFYATGYLPFNLYQTVSGTVSKSILFSKP